MLQAVEMVACAEVADDVLVMRVSYESAVDGRADWALAEPRGDAKLWLVNLHGHGSHGDQLYTREDIRDNWLPPIRGLGLSILAPNLRDNAWMCPAAVDDLHDLLEWARAEHDAQQFIFLGGSMGGTGCLIYTIRHPEDVAAVCALCPATDLTEEYRFCRASSQPIPLEIADAIEAAYGGTPKDVPEAYGAHSTRTHAARLTMPVHVAHGTADPLIGIEHAHALERALAGTPTFSYTEILDGGHDAPLFRGGMETWLRAQTECLNKRF